MFYKEVQVEKNQPYKITCMVKTENVIPQEQQAGIGAQISIEGSTERSIAIQGTNEWQKIELIFNSKNRDSINIGFRLGGNLGLAKGKAWFSDFKLEEGTTNSNNEWKFACFILKTTDVNLNGKGGRKWRLHICMCTPNTAFWTALAALKSCSIKRRRWGRKALPLPITA